MNKNSLVCLFTTLVCCLGTLSARAAETAAPRAVRATPAGAIDSLPLTDNAGHRVHLGDPAYRGKVLLVVNTASQCGYTGQYAGLQKLYATYAKRGLAVLAFPSNDFGQQEPGSDTEIKQFCSNTYKIEFPLFSKAPVSGSAAQPLFKSLVAQPNTRGEVKWNFEKFLLGRDHALIARFSSQVTPDSPELVAAIEKALGQI